MAVPVTARCRCRRLETRSLSSSFSFCPWHPHALRKCCLVLPKGFEWMYAVPTAGGYADQAKRSVSSVCKSLVHREQAAEYTVLIRPCEAAGKLERSDTTAERGTSATHNWKLRFVLLLLWLWLLAGAGVGVGAGAGGGGAGFVSFATRESKPCVQHIWQDDSFVAPAVM